MHHVNIMVLIFSIKYALYKTHDNNYYGGNIMKSLVELAGEIVSAHVATTKMTSDQMLEEIKRVHAALVALEQGVEAPVVEEQKPAMTWKQSIKTKEIICLICNKGGMQSLSRHLSTAHGMKPGEYKKQFGIPSKQSLTAKKFSEERRKMAVEKNLGAGLAAARAKRAEKLKGKKAPAKTKSVAPETPASSMIQPNK